MLEPIVFVAYLSVLVEHGDVVVGKMFGVVEKELVLVDVLEPIE